MASFARTLLGAAALSLSLGGSVALAAPTWSVQEIEAWHGANGWMAGANYLPATAINQLEMWQADTFDPKTIDKELAKAKSLGMKTMRVFLHDLAYAEDPAGFKQRVDTFLGIAAKHGIRPMMVIFDSVWDPEPKVGVQRRPTPGVHNSGWVQSPGRAGLQPSEHGRLEAYVKDVVGTFAKDARIASWDVWNEPDNLNGASYGKHEAPNKLELVEGLLPKVFAWARAVRPSQPLTSGLWQGDWSSREALTPIQRIQLDESDFGSFHNYDPLHVFKTRIAQLRKLTPRALHITEYMARGAKNTFRQMLPELKRQNISAYNWGFVQGKAQTEMPWDSWQTPYTAEPKLWFHEIFRKDGRPYIPSETKLIKKLTGASKPLPGKRGRFAKR